MSFNDEEIPEEYIAGKCEVIAGRESQSGVAKNQLISDYHECIKNLESGYCFLRVLKGNEIRRFIDTMEGGLVDDCYRTRAIKTTDWMRILRSIELECEYYVYRKSYWGENAGRTVVSPKKTSTMTLVSVISGARAKVSEDDRKSYWGEKSGRALVSRKKTSTMMTLVSFISGARAKVLKDEIEVKNEEDECTGLIEGFSRLGLTIKRVNLLIEDNHVAIIDKVKPAYWSNDSYELDDTENVIKM